MRVVHVHRIAGIGGSERHLLTLLPALARLGAEPFFLGLDGGGEPEPFYRGLDRAGVPSFRLPAPSDADPRLLRRVARSLRGLRPDLVHTHLVHADVYAGLAAARLGLPLVSTKHNDDPFRLGPYRHVERALTRRTAAVVAITHALARFCVERVGLPEEKVSVVHYGLDGPPAAWASDEAAAPEGARVLLAVSRLVEQKGVDVAIRALAELGDERAILVVLGEGPDRPELEALARSLGVEERVRLPGRSGDVAAWLARAECLVHPARWEGFGLVLLEAMLAGLPVVASRVSSIPEIVADGATGLLVGADDAPGLARALDSLLADPQRARRLGEAGRERARAEFSEERMARRTIALYERALSGRASGTRRG